MTPTSVPASPAVVSQLDIARGAGLRAKCSYLLSVLADDATSAPERAAATWALVADAPRILPALSDDDLGRLRDTLVEVLGNQPSWTVQSFPDEAVTDPELIDGLNVRRVVVPPAGDGPTCVDVARIHPPRSGGFVVSSECTLDGDGTARVEVVDRRGQVLASAALEAGHARFATIAVPGQSDAVTVRIVNAAPVPVLWYQSTTAGGIEGGADHLAGLVRREVASRRPTDPTSVFVPVTSEPLTLPDIERFMSLRDRFAGERIFVMGNGPSLNRTPLDRLDGEFVFGVNRVSLLFERVSWRPTFFTAFDVRVVPDNKEEFAALDVPYKFFSARYKQMLGARDNHFWHHTKGHYEGFDHAFEPTVVYSGFGGGGTIGVIAIELAFFMGFREILLIGTDVSYTVPETVKQEGEDEFGDGVKLELQSTRDDDANHFDPRYFGTGKKWHNPNVREMKIGFARAAAYVEQRGGRLRNATVGGDLDEVERVDFDSLF